MTNKEMRQAIIDKYEGIPDRQVKPGKYLKSAGSKYVHVLNIWHTVKTEKTEIKDFYNDYILRLDD